ncbi:ATP-dependent RecD-like DNA helicase, partial [Anaerosalibacter bizertensis]|nr:ATP-dependent RecD-like DNA helicase [Anaerosalibacter bizertensis]
MITVEGIVEDIIFRNESNGFTVAKLHAEEDSITIVGNVPFLNIGQSVEVAGEMIYHPNYGEQIKIENVSTITPKTLDGIEKYLS